MPATAPADQFAVLLYFDAAAEAAVRKVGQRLAAGGFQPASQVRPHITLAVCERLDVEGFRRSLAEVARLTRHFECTLASVGVFPGEEGVIFLAPTASGALIEVQEQIVDRLARRGAQVSAYWLRGNWVPHCTLAIGIPRERISTAVGIAHEAFRLIQGHLTEVSLVNVALGESCYTFDLSP